ncbi:MAG: hypothetical protein ABUM51_08820, partial [Bacteroidota bacterium]
MKMVLVLLIITAFEACAQKINFTTSSVEPAAVGRVKVKKDNNNNYVIDVKITHLASPKRLNPPKDLYVVWIETGNNGIKNIGKIHSSSGFLSQTLKGSLKAVTSFKPIKVFITAETDGDIHHPGIPVVLTTEGF